MRAETSTDDAGAFAASLGLHATDEDAVYRNLINFPDACRSRGMFATGILEAVRRRCGAGVADRIRLEAGYPARIMGFALYPHRDFYRLFYASAAAMYPRIRLGEGMRRIAESFYPIFIESLPGRTLHVLVGRTPEVVLRRFVEAYKISTPWNEHEVESHTDRELIWRCMVEPCPNYPDTFAGISTGMVETVTGIRPRYEVINRVTAKDHQRITFRISW